MHKKIRKGGSKNLTVNKLAVFVMFMSLIIFGIQIVNKNYKNIKLAKETQEKLDATSLQNSNKDKNLGYDIGKRWKIYQDTIYGIEIAVPKLLAERTFNDTGRFLKFVMFEETQFSSEKGVALGISKLGMNEELAELKKDMLEEKSIIVGEENIKVDRLDAILLTFEPEDKEKFEKKSVFLVSKNDMTFSVSSVPEQIQRLIDNFKFL